jgi:molybdate transport system regulatory protein
VAAIVTSESIQNLGLKVGVRACALIKASHIILAVNA